MTPEQAITEARKLEQAVIEAFGLDPVSTMDIDHTGLYVKLADGRKVNFPPADWTPTQEEAVNGLYKHFPRRWIGSIPADWEIEEMMKQ